MKTYRKLIALLMTVVMLVGMMPVSLAESIEPMTTVCNHDYEGKWVNGAPKNCQEWKDRTYTCKKCKDSFTWSECGDCNYKWSWDKKPDSCQEWGIKNGVCTVCGEPTEREAKGDHKWTDWKTTTPGDCTKAAKEERTCTYCKKTETRTGSKGDHKWGEWKTDKKATCTSGGTEKRTCSVCKKTESRNTNALGHDFGDWFRSGVPTCTKAGVNRRNCERCDHYETKSIPKLDHDFGEWYVVTEPQVGVPGLEQRDCNYGCGTSEQREIPAIISAAGLDLKLVLSSTPANGIHFVVGEEVTFTATWVNNTDMTLDPFCVPIFTCAAPVYGSEIDQISSWYAEDHGGPVAPGASASHALTVTVTEADVARGSIYACAEILATVHNGADLETVAAPYVTAPCGEILLPKVELVKTIDSVPANGAFYVPGEQIEFVLALHVYGPDQTTPSEAYQVNQPEIHDPLRGNNDLMMADVSGYNMGISLMYTVTEEDAQRGYVENTGYATWIYRENGEAGRVDSNTVSAPCGSGKTDIAFSKFVGNTPANGEYFVPGEVIEFWIEVSNFTGANLALPVVTDPMCTDNFACAAHPGTGCLFIDNSVDTFNHGSSYGIKVPHTVTIEEGKAGSVSNTATVQYTLGNGESKTRTASATAITGMKPPKLTVTKKVSIQSPHGGAFYTGEEIPYEITVTNECSEPLYEVEIADPLKGGNEDSILDIIPELAPGESVTVTFTHIGTIEEADPANGECVTNTAYASGHTIDGVRVNGESNTVVVTLFHIGEMELTKTVVNTPPNGEYFVPGDTIEFAITMTNNSFYPFYVPTLTDPLCEDQYIYDAANDMSYLFFDGEILNGHTETVTVKYVVTQADAEAGSVTNTATLTYMSFNGDEMTVSASATAKCGKLDGDDAGLESALSVIKIVTSTPANGSYYVPGELVTYQLYVQNNGEELNDLDVSDWMWGDSHAWEGNLAAGATVSYPVTHIVTDADARAEHVNNIAYATAVDKDGNQVAEYSNLVTVPCGFPDEDGKPEDPFGIFHSLAIVKAEDSLPMNGQYYTEGEVIHYTITYTNDGELPLTDVQVWDNLDINTTIGHAEMLQPGESRTCYYQHTVTAEDVAIGSVLNMAQANYPIPNGEGYANVNSNLVISKTSADPIDWTESPLFPEGGKDPAYDPIVGWLPDPEGKLPSFGSIDTGLLRSGDDYCVRTITARDNVNASYEIDYCGGHVDTQTAVLTMKKAAVTPETQMQAAAYAVALWRAEVEELYKEIFAAADPMAKTTVATEYVRFLTEVANYETLLKQLYPDQPALAAQAVADVWEDKCVSLCYEAHAAAEERKDSLLSVEAATGAAAAECTCAVTTEENDKKAYTQSHCAVHSFPFSMTDALLMGADTAEAWGLVRQIWYVELTSTYNKVNAKLGENSILGQAEFYALTQWMMAREASLIALYPDNPELVAQTMVKLIMDRTNALCQPVK